MLSSEAVQFVGDLEVQTSLFSVPTLHEGGDHLLSWKYQRKRFLDVVVCCIITCKVNGLKYVALTAMIL